MWQSEIVRRGALSAPRTHAPAAATAAVFETGHNLRGQAVRSQSPISHCFSYGAPHVASLPNLAQPVRTRSRAAGSLPTSPQVQFRPLPTSRLATPLPTSRLATPTVESQFSTQKAELYASIDLPSDSALLAFQHSPSQSISIAASRHGQSPSVERLQAFIGRELEACREALTASQEAFMTKFMATLDARLEANHSCQNNSSASNLRDLENDLRKLEGSQNEMEARMNKFEIQVLSFFELFEDCLRGLQQGTSSIELQLASISCAETAERQNVGQIILQGSGGQSHTLSKRSSAAPHVATGSCKHVSEVAKHCQTTSPSPGCGESQQGSGSGTPWTKTSMPETSLRVEALEMALASMQQQEQERICRLKEKIRGLQKA